MENNGTEKIGLVTPTPGPLMTLFTDANMNPKSSNAHAGISCNETMSDQHDVVSG